MDHFAGLDVSVKETSVCIVDDVGKIVREVKVASEPEALLAVLKNPAYHFKRIGLEAGPLSQWLYSALAGAELPVICVETRHMRAVLKAQINKTDRNDARGIAQMMRAGLYRPVHVKTLRSQKLRMLLTHRKLLQAKAIAVENDLRATLRNFGLKVGVVGTVKFEASINEAYVIHASSVAVSREHRRAKTDRLDTELLKRSFLGWLRGERDHCKMVEIPTMQDEDAKRPNREHDSLIGERSRIVNRMKAALVRLGIRGFNPKLKRATTRLDGLHTPEGEPIPPNALAELRRDMERRRLVNNQIRQIEEERLERIEQAPCDGAHVMVRLLARVMGVGIETADMLVHEVLSRNMRDRRAVARYAGLTGSPDESGRKRREKGLARSGNARVRRGMIQLAWRFLLHQKNSALTKWFRSRTENARGTRKPMIVALARKLLIALWRLMREGIVPDGVVLRPAQ